MLVYFKKWFKERGSHFKPGTNAFLQHLRKHLILVVLKKYLFTYFWLWWVFLATCSLSLVVVSRGYSLLRCMGFSLQWLLLRSIGSRYLGFSSCGVGFVVVVAHGLSCSMARGIFPSQGSKWCPLHCKAILNHWNTREDIWFWCHRAPDIIWRKCGCAGVCACMRVCVCLCECLTYALSCSCCSITKWCPTLWDPHRVQQTRLTCPSLSPGVCSNSNVLSWWRHPTISSSVTRLSFCPQTSPASGSFLVSWLLTLGGSIMLLGFSKGVQDSEKDDTLLHEGKVIQWALTRGLLSLLSENFEIKLLLFFLPRTRISSWLCWWVDGTSLSLEPFTPLSHDMKTAVHETANSLKSHVKNDLCLQ